MKQFVICDKRVDFIHDIKMRALLDERECTITEITDAAKFNEKKTSFVSQILVVCENMLEELPDGFERQFQPASVVGYWLTAGGKEKFASKKIECLGQITSSAQLLSMLFGFPGQKADINQKAPEITEKESVPAPTSAKEDFNSWKQSIHQKSEAVVPPAVESGRVSSLLELREQRVKKETDLLIKREKEAKEPAQRADVITITSTKGGVGKTTVATQLACCMALTSHGRGRFRVCLVDFDIGFGDVCTALDYDLSGPTIGTWLEDIRKRVASGEEIHSISYSEEEIKSFLQVKKDTGLYALLAPQNHTDSLDITADELDVIMRSLQENGGFDFIVYDTGNDLKDSTLMALEQSKYVLLIATQDISCAHCLDMLIKTMDSIRFDRSKIRLVINNVMSAKATGISVSELEESFDYPCWARIKHDPAIIRSSNFGRPVVFSATHDMTKQLRNTIRYLNEGNGPLQQEEPAKKFWKKLFSKKGGE